MAGLLGGRRRGSVTAVRWRSRNSPARVGQLRGVRASRVSLSLTSADSSVRSARRVRVTGVRAHVSAPRVRPRLDLLTWRPSAAHGQSCTSFRAPRKLISTSHFFLSSPRVVVVVESSRIESSREDVKVSASGACVCASLPGGVFSSVSIVVSLHLARSRVSIRLPRESRDERDFQIGTSWQQGRCHPRATLANRYRRVG